MRNPQSDVNSIISIELGEKITDCNEIKKEAITRNHNHIGIRFRIPMWFDFIIFYKLFLSGVDIVSNSLFILILCRNLCHRKI